MNLLSEIKIRTNHRYTFISYDTYFCMDWNRIKSDIPSHHSIVVNDFWSLSFRII